MPLYKPSELKVLMEKLGVRPKKRYSQNFLIDGNILRKIGDFAAIGPRDAILEIGPGPGALTQELLRRGARVLAIEKDPIWANALKDLPGDLTVLCEDALTCDLEDRIDHWNGKGKIKLVANLPYHITTPLLTRLVPLEPLFSSLTVMVQEEVARRFTAPPGSKVYGSITLFLNFWADVEYGFPIKNTSFYPAPKVSSALIRLTPHTPPIDLPDPFFKMTRLAFSQRRKMLKTSLKPLLSQVVLTIESALLEKRPEQLSLDDFLKLHDMVKNQRL